MKTKELAEIAIEHEGLSEYGKQCVRAYVAELTPSNMKSIARLLFVLLTDEERMQVTEGYCKFCGQEGRCFCNRDD